MQEENEKRVTVHDLCLATSRFTASRGLRGVAERTRETNAGRRALHDVGIWFVVGPTPGGCLL